MYRSVLQVMLLQGNPVHPLGNIVKPRRNVHLEIKFVIYMKNNGGHTEALTGDFM